MWSPAPRSAGRRRNCSCCWIHPSHGRGDPEAQPGAAVASAGTVSAGCGQGADGAERQTLVSGGAGVKPACHQRMLRAGRGQLVQRAGCIGAPERDRSDPRPGGADPPRRPDCGAPYPPGGEPSGSPGDDRPLGWTGGAAGDGGRPPNQCWGGLGNAPSPCITNLTRADQRKGGSSDSSLPPSAWCQLRQRVTACT